MSEFIISGFADEISENFSEQLSHLNTLGISYIEVRGVDGKNISKLSDAEVALAKEKLKDAGIKVSSIGSPVGKDEISEDFSEQLARFSRIVEIAKKFQSKYIRIFSFFNAGEQKDEVVRRLSEFVKIAERENVILLHENEKDIFGESDENCAYLFEKIKSPNFKAVFDPANFVQAGVETYPKAFNLLKDNVVYMHIKDALADGSVVPAGAGIGKIKEIIAELKNSGYEGFLSLEPHLGQFKGLAGLERGDIKQVGDSGPDKFTLAYNSLMEIIASVE